MRGRKRVDQLVRDKVAENHSKNRDDLIESYAEKETKANRAMLDQGTTLLVRLEQEHGKIQPKQETDDGHKIWDIEDKKAKKKAAEKLAKAEEAFAKAWDNGDFGDLKRVLKENQDILGKN